MNKKTNISTLPQKSLYYLVLFSENFVIFDKPFYSLPNYDKKGIGIKKLEQNILKGSYGKGSKYAVIYDNKTRLPIKYIINGLEVKNFKIPKTQLKLWILYTNGKKKIIKTPINNEEAAYWELVNKHIKAKGQRSKIQLALIYDDTNELIGKFRRYKSKTQTKFTGIGKYHKYKL